MIILRLEAEGFMRYQRLALRDLPTRGIVAVLGENESGKSTLGECLAFALYGETIKSRATDVSQVVAWDADRAHVTLELEAASGRRWVLERTADRHGGHEASLTPLDASESGGVSARVEGVDAVAQALRALGAPSFDELRLSFYLGQQELDLLRGGDGGEGRAVLEEITGVAALERAAERTHEALEDLAADHAELRQELAVAEALFAAQAVDPDASAALEAHGAEWQHERDAAHARLPTAEAAAARARDAVAARAACGNTFNALARALVARAAERSLEALGGELGRLAASVHAEIGGREVQVAHARSESEGLRRRIDRVIAYRTRVAQLEARIELYRNEVRRNLEAPQVDAEDLALLEGLAMPSTPAASAQLAEARVTRVRAARNRAGWRAAIFLVVGLAFSFIGLPALWRLVSDGAVATSLKVAGNLAESAEAVSSISQVAGGLERAVRALGFDPTSKTWVWLAVAGSLGLGIGSLLGVLSLAQLRERGDHLKLSIEARDRLQGEVEALRAEVTCLEGLTAHKPLELHERVRNLRNPVIRELIERLLEEFAELTPRPVQGDALVTQEREEEGRCREVLTRLEERLARLHRLARRMPAPGASPDVAAEIEPDPVPESLDVFERDAEALLERFERARRDLREAGRAGAAPGDPRALLEALGAELARVLGADARAEVDRALVGLTRLVDEVEVGAVAADDVEPWLEAESDRLDELLPPAERLLALREACDADERAIKARLADAEGRVEALRERRADMQERQRGHRERAERVRALAERAAPLARSLEVHRLAEELLRESAGDVRRRVGPMLARFASEVLPRLTGGRYRRVRVSPSLEVKVYSPDKNDYVPLVDLSLGTSDQLLLALRLGVGLALIRARGLGANGHFLFLDEPLASFDARRARAFLDVLAQNSAHFPQVFLVAHHRFGELEERFARVIRTRVDRRVLVSPPEADDAEHDPGDEPAHPADQDRSVFQDTEEIEPTVMLDPDELPARAERVDRDVEAFADLSDVSP